MKVIWRLAAVLGLLSLGFVWVALTRTGPENYFPLTKSPASQRASLRSESFYIPLSTPADSRGHLLRVKAAAFLHLPPEEQELPPNGVKSMLASGTGHGVDGWDSGGDAIVAADEGLIVDPGEDSVVAAGGNAVVGAGADAGESKSEGDGMFPDALPMRRITVSQVPGDSARFGQARYGWELASVGVVERIVAHPPAAETGGAPPRHDYPSNTQVAQLDEMWVPPSDGDAAEVQLAQRSVIEGPTAQRDTVLSQPQPQHQTQGLSLDSVLLPPKGWDLGIVPEWWREAMATLTLFPAFDVEEKWDDNLFRVEHEIKSDRITLLTPSMDIRSEWVRHAIDLFGEITWGIHERYDAENYTDFRLQSEGRLDVLSDMKSVLTLSHLRNHEQRGSPDDPGINATAPIYFETFARLNTEFDSETLLIRNGLEAKRVNFRSSGETANDDRDRLEYTGTLRLGYHFYPGTTVFIEPQVNARNYLENIDYDGFRRDGAGWRLEAGATYDVSGVSFLELGAGYLKQWYYDRELNTVQGISFSGRLIWNITDVITLTGDLERAVRETTQLGTSGILESSARLRLDYGFLDDMLVKFETSFKDEDYDGIARDDKTFTLGTGISYMLGHCLVADATYDYTHRKANNVEDSNYTNNVFSIRIRLQQ